MVERAVEYVRMSTEHQRYSTENQSDVIGQYAAKRGIEIVRTYAEAGKSGLRLEGRDALKRLIDDVQHGRADFTTILVYDVSRWGRFQDCDESAYYEFLCRRSGVNDPVDPRRAGGPPDSIGALRRCPDRCWGRPSLPQ